MDKINQLLEKAIKDYHSLIEEYQYGNYIDESLGRNGIYVSTNSTLTRISLPLIEDDEITRVVDNLELNI